MHPGSQKRYITTGAVLANKYEIIGLIGRGGMGSVYEAREVDFEIPRTVAVKVLLPELLDRDAGFERRFREEIKISARMDHPNIIPIYNVGHDGSLFFFVMKYIQGHTLKQLIERDGPLPEKSLRSIAGQMTSALSHIHQAGAIHRDIKSNNIMVDHNGHATLMDFGIAHSDDAHTRLTASGEMVGTGPYVSPEQWHGRYDHRSDIYSFGIVLYELATGQLPFQADQIPKLMNMILNRPVPAVRKSRGDLSENLCEIIHTCLRKDPDERYRSMDHLADALAGCQVDDVGMDATVIEKAGAEPPDKKPGSVTAALGRLEKAKQRNPDDPVVAQLEEDYRRLAQEERMTLDRMREFVRHDEHARATEVGEAFVAKYHSNQVRQDLGRIQDFIALTEKVFTEAEVLALKKKMPQAKPLYEKVLARDPNNERAREMLAKLGDVQGEPLGAPRRTGRGSWKRRGVWVAAVLLVGLFFMPKFSPSFGASANEFVGDLARGAGWLCSPPYLNAYAAYERSRVYLGEQGDATHLLVKLDELVAKIVEAGDDALLEGRNTEALDRYTEVLRLRPLDEAIKGKIEQVTLQMEAGAREAGTTP